MTSNNLMFAFAGFELAQTMYMLADDRPRRAMWHALATFLWVMLGATT